MVATEDQCLEQKASSQVVSLWALDELLKIQDPGRMRDVSLMAVRKRQPRMPHKLKEQTDFSHYFSYTTSSLSTCGSPPCCHVPVSPAEMTWQFLSWWQRADFGLLKVSQGRSSFALSSDFLRTCCTYLQDLHFAFCRQTLKCNSRWKSQACLEPMWVFMWVYTCFSVLPLTLMLTFCRNLLE